MPKGGVKSMQPLCVMHVVAASTTTTAHAALLKPQKFSTCSAALRRLVLIFSAIPEISSVDVEKASIFLA
jgi:hypothetical protein